jgi:enoyl-CoA hydratase/carnithine racemase
VTGPAGPQVRYEVATGIAYVTLNRPERHNAIGAAGRRQLTEALRSFADDPAAAVLIVTAAGDRSFCAGADLTELGPADLPPSAFSDCLQPLADTAKPTIAAVNGAALGGGFLLAQSCDLCIASDRATFGITEARWGRGAPWALPLFDMVPRRIVLELLFTGTPIAARRASEIGLVNGVVAHDELASAAQALAARIAANAPLSVRAHKAMSRLASPATAAALPRAWNLFAPVYASADAQEGPRAFREKRAPAWQGR